MLAQKTTRRLQAIWITRLFVVLAFLGAGTVEAQLTDSGVHAPPTTGAYAYNTFVPGSTGFPGLGGTYVDPVFGMTVRRLTTYSPANNDDDIYAHSWCNANGTYCFDTNGGGLRIISATTGATLWSGQPNGNSSLSRANIQWHPTNPDKYQYVNTTEIHERTLSTQTEVTFATLANPPFSTAATYTNFGGTLNWVDKTGDVYALTYGGASHIWRRSTNTLYSGAGADGSPGGSYNAITPDGNYLVVGGGSNQTSYAINHTTQTVGPANIFWSLCGDHADLISASDGHSYSIILDCNYTAGVWRVDVGLTAGTPAQQHAANKLLIPLTFPQTTDHFSCVHAGSNSDWCFVDQELAADTFNSGVSGWIAFEQEIIAVNVVTGALRRLAHHRSRSTANYYYAPKVSSSWDGSIVIWASNYNVDNGGHLADDRYAIASPLGSVTNIPPPAAPTGLTIN